MFEKACFPPRTTGRGKNPFRDRARLRVDLPRRAAGGSPGHGPSPRRPDSIHFSRPMADIPPPPRTTSSTRQPPQANTRMGRGGGSSGDAQADMPSGQASGATCVQKLDDSRNSAIHTTYRISLRSSSLREPRYPLLRVVCYSSKFASPSGGARAPGEGKEGSDSLGRTWCVAHPRGKNPTPARVRPPGELAAKGPNSHRKPEERTRRRAPRTGARTRARHDRQGRPPPARGAREDESVFAGFTALCVQ